MGDANQRYFLKRLVPEFEGRILEVGSKDYGNTTSFREEYPASEYIGVDIEPGPGVDRVVDLTEGLGDLAPASFDLAICCSVLEHVRRPWRLAGHLGALLRPGGLLYISVPWVWRYHAYPDDYWRFSWRGVSELFDGFDWEQMLYSTNVPGEFLPLQPDTDDRMHYFKALDEQRRRKYLPYLNVNMLGRRR